MHWVYENGEVLSRTARDDGSLEIIVRLAPEKIERLVQRFPDATRDEDAPESTLLSPMDED